MRFWQADALRLVAADPRTRTTALRGRGRRPSGADRSSLFQVTFQEQLPVRLDRVGEAPLSLAYATGATDSISAAAVPARVPEAAEQLATRGSGLVSRQSGAHREASRREADLIGSRVKTAGVSGGG